MFLILKQEAKYYSCHFVHFWKNSYVHSDYVNNGIYTIYIYLVVVMPKVKGRVLFPLHNFLQRHRKLAWFSHHPSPMYQWHLLLHCLWWGLYLGKKQWIVSCSLPYFSLHLNIFFPLLVLIPEIFMKTDCSPLSLCLAHSLLSFLYRPCVPQFNCLALVFILN